LYGRQRASSGSIRLVVLRLWGDPATTPLYPLSLHDALPILSVWFGMQAPAGTPASIIKKVNAGMTDMLKEKDVIERFGKQGVEVVASTPEQFKKLVNAEVTKWTGVADRAGITIEEAGAPARAAP